MEKEDLDNLEAKTLFIEPYATRLRFVTILFGCVSAVSVVLLISSILGYSSEIMIGIASWAGLTILLLWKPEIVLPIFIVGQSVIHFLFFAFGGVSRSQVSGSALMTSILLWLAIFAALITMRIREKPKWTKIPLRYTLATMPLFLVILAGTVYTAAPKYGLMKATGFLVFNLSVSYAILFLINTKKRFKVFLWAALVLSAFQAVALSAVTYFQSGLLFKRIAPGPRESLFEGFAIAGHQDLGRRFMVAALAAASLALLAKSRVSKIILMFISLLLVIWIIFATARGPVLATAVAVLAMVALLWLAGKGKAIWPVAILLAGLIIGFAAAEKEISNRLLSKTINARESMGYRKYTYRKSADIFVSAPLGGVGTGGFAAKTFGVDERIYPHNIELEILSENGFIGFGAFIFFIGLTILYGLRTIKRSVSKSTRVFAVWALASFFGTLTFAQFSGDLTRNDQLWIFAALVFCTAGFAELQHKEDIESRTMITPQNTRSTAHIET